VAGCRRLPDAPAGRSRIVVEDGRTGRRSFRLTDWLRKAGAGVRYSATRLPDGSARTGRLEHRRPREKPAPQVFEQASLPELQSVAYGRDDARLDARMSRTSLTRLDGTTYCPAATRYSCPQRLRAISSSTLSPASRSTRHVREEPPAGKLARLGPIGAHVIRISEVA
jgi:hypothetical protein